MPKEAYELKSRQAVSLWSLSNYREIHLQRVLASNNLNVS